jgi:hypothetical protein
MYYMCMYVHGHCMHACMYTNLFLLYEMISFLLPCEYVEYVCVYVCTCMCMCIACMHVCICIWFCSMERFRFSCFVCMYLHAIRTFIIIHTCMHAYLHTMHIYTASHDQTLVLIDDNTYIHTYIQSKP